MLYDPGDLEPYAPLWRWDLGSYALLQGTKPCKPFKLQLYMQGAVHARSSWVTLELRECTAPTLLDARREDLAAVKRLDLQQGVGPWRLWDLVVTESHIGALANKGRLSRRHGNLASAILKWPSDPFVRSQCDNQTTTTTVAECAGTVIVELPDLADKQELLGPMLQHIESALDASAVRWDDTPAFCSTYEGIALAFKEGNISPIGRRLRVRVPLGEPELVRPSEPSRWLQRELLGIATTDVRLGALPQVLEMSVLPPVSLSEIRLFNEHLGLSPVHLLSWEVLRVSQTLRCVRKWVSVSCAVDCWTATTRNANVVEDLVLRKQFICVDSAAECFQPIPHLWRSNHVHGRDSASQEVDPA